MFLRCSYTGHRPPRSRYPGKDRVPGTEMLVDPPNVSIFASRRVGLAGAKHGKNGKQCKLPDHIVSLPRISLHSVQEILSTRALVTGLRRSSLSNNPAFAAETHRYSSSLMRQQSHGQIATIPMT